MFVRLLLLFTLVPIIELAILIKIGQHLGVWPTIGIILGTGLLGASLARWRGLKILRQIGAELAHGRIPGDPILSGLMVLVAGALLLTPGVLTDLAGLLLLTPPVQRLVGRRLKSYFRQRVKRESVHLDVYPVDSPPIEEGGDRDRS